MIFEGVAIGYSEDVDIPKQAIEINDLGALYYYTSIPVLDSFHTYKGRIRIEEAKHIISYIGNNMQCMSRLDTFETSDISKIELFSSVKNGKSAKHGYGYFGDCVNGDSISKTFEVYKTSERLEPIDGYKFQTTIQNEELPPPPPLPIK